MARAGKSSDRQQGLGNLEEKTESVTLRPSGEPRVLRCQRPRAQQVRLLYPVRGMSRLAALPETRVPFATYALLVSNAVIFAFLIAMGGRGASFLDSWGLTPGEVIALLTDGSGRLQSLVTVFTAMFLHANAVHLLANMVFLWVFGERVEHLLGTGRFLALYFLGGVLAALAQVLMALDTTVVAVGSSGAVAAIIGAYLAFNPYAPLASFAPRAIRIPVDVLAVALLGMWVLSQAFSGLAEAGYATMNVADGALWAHLAGFAAGIVLAPALRARRRLT
jgi:membrane associated rhomboid family serine protease